MRAACQAASTLVLVTSREPEDALYQELVGPEGHAPGLKVQRIGDCRQPALIAHAVYAGYQAARELDEEDAAAAAAARSLRDLKRRGFAHSSSIESVSTALRRAMKSSIASSCAGSIPGSSYSASIFFHTRWARCSAVSRPSSDHCS